MKVYTCLTGALILLFAAAQVGAADSIYSWTDDSGRVHFGDKKPDDHTVKTLDLSTAPSIRPVPEAEIMQLLPGRWLHNTPHGREALHFRANRQVTGALLLGGSSLREFRGTWRLIDGWMILEILLLDDEQRPEREVSFAITELTEYTKVQTARNGAKQYWYFTGRRR